MIRYAITFRGKDGLRVILGPAQGRFMKKTRTEAEQSLCALLTSNTRERLADIYGEAALETFRVDPFHCWDHGDPKGIYADEKRAPEITQLSDWSEEDHARAQRIARKKGYTQTAFTSSSHLHGLFCLPDNCKGRRGCIIKTRELGFLFVQDEEDITGEVQP